YGDYAVWQRNHRNAERMERQRAYWRRELDGLQPLRLPLDHPRLNTPSLRGAAERETLPVALADRLRKLSRQSRSTLFVTMLAAFKLLLYRYTSQTDVAVGSPIANRVRPEIEPLI